MTDNVKASIIILTKNAGDNFRNLLSRLFSQRFDGKYEILMVDSGSTDSTLKTAAEFPVVIKRISPEEFHHGKTRNLGAKLARGEILAYITQDALPLDDQWLQKLTDNLRQPAVAMVVGRQIPWQTSKPPEKFFYSYNFPDFRITVKLDASDFFHDNIFISNVNSAVRKDVWQEFKFSEKVIMCEDKEFAKRVLFAGLSIIYEPEAMVCHSHDFGLRAAFRRASEYGISWRQGVAGMPVSRGPRVRKLMLSWVEEIKYLNDTGDLQWLPYCMLYNINTYLGSFLGQVGLVKPRH